MCTLPKTNSSPLKKAETPKGKERLPTINSQVRTLSFREGSSCVVFLYLHVCKPMLEARQEQETREAQEALHALEVRSCSDATGGMLDLYP